MITKINIDWLDYWSDEVEKFYYYVSDYGQWHYKCGWEPGDHWTKIDEISEGMCSKEWDERNYVIEMIIRAKAINFSIPS